MSTNDDEDKISYNYYIRVVVGHIFNNYVLSLKNDITREGEYINNLYTLKDENSFLFNNVNLSLTIILLDDMIKNIPSYITSDFRTEIKKDKSYKLWESNLINDVMAITDYIYKVQQFNNLNDCEQIVRSSDLYKCKLKYDIMDDVHRIYFSIIDTIGQLIHNKLISKKKIEMGDIEYVYDVYAEAASITKNIDSITENDEIYKSLPYIYRNNIILKKQLEPVQENENENLEEYIQENVQENNKAREELIKHKDINDVVETLEKVIVLYDDNIYKKFSTYIERITKKTVEVVSKMFLSFISTLITPVVNGAQYFASQIKDLFESLVSYFGYYTKFVAKKIFNIILNNKSIIFTFSMIVFLGLLVYYAIKNPGIHYNRIFLVSLIIIKAFFDRCGSIFGFEKGFFNTTIEKIYYDIYLPIFQGNIMQTFFTFLNTKGYSLYNYLCKINVIDPKTKRIYENIKLTNSIPKNTVQALEIMILVITNVLQIIILIPLSALQSIRKYFLEK